MSRNANGEVISPYIFLHTSQLYDALVDRTFGDQAVHRDLTGLSESVGAIHRLRVVGRIPVVIIEDDGVCSSQVDTQTTRTGTKQEDEDIRPASASRMDQIKVKARGRTESASP